MQKRPEKDEARALYESGKTYPEIAAALRVSKSTVSLWCRDLVAMKREQRAAKIASRPTPPRPPLVREVAESPYQDYYLYSYQSTDGVARVQLVHRETGKRLALSLARYRMSVRENRILDRSEIVAHRNGPSDDIDNLIITTHAGKGMMRRAVPERECVICEETFIPKKKTVETCSRACKSVLVSGILTGRKYS